MATIADGVSAGFKQKTEADKKMITDNLVKYIVGENKTSHKVGRDNISCISSIVLLSLEICLRISSLSVSEHCYQLPYIQSSRQVHTGKL